MNSQPPVDRHIAFAYVGPLHTRGRLLKQIETLQQAGARCEVMLGNTDERSPEPEEFGFPIRQMRVDQNRGKIASFINQMRFCRKAARWITESGADTVVCLALESLMAGVWAKRRKPSMKLIFDNNELHLESYGPGLKSRIWGPIHNYAIRRCDVILHAEANRMAYFRKHYDAGGARQQVLENFPSFVENVSRLSGPSDEVRVIYLGGFGEGRFTLEIIRAFAEMPKTVRLDIVGTGRPDFVNRAERLADELDAPNVRLLPPVPYMEIPNLLKDYHIGVALYRNTNLNNYFCAPNKVYDYLMNGLPVITNRYPGLIPVIEGNRVGACLEEVDGESIRKAVEAIVNGRSWDNITDTLRRRYCWESQVDGYLGIFTPDERGSGTGGGAE